MSDIFREYDRRFTAMDRRIDGLPYFRWGVVTNVAPLMVRLDGDADALFGSPSTLLAGVSVGNRVYVSTQAGRVTIIGAAKGNATSVLWVGNWYLGATQTVTFARPISTTHTGIVLVWDLLDTPNAGVSTFFIPKLHVAAVGEADYHIFMGAGAVSAGGIIPNVRKIAKISDTQIKGHVSNTAEPSSRYALRRVIAV